MGENYSNAIRVGVPFFFKTEEKESFNCLKTVKLSTCLAWGGSSITFHSLLQILEKVYVQFQSFLEDPQYKDQHELQTTMIRTFGKVAPHAEPHFRDEGNSRGLHFNLHHLQCKKVMRASGLMVFSPLSCDFLLLFAEYPGMIFFVVCYYPFDREFYFFIFF